MKNACKTGLLAISILAVMLTFAVCRKNDGNVVVERHPLMEMPIQEKPTMPAPNSLPFPRGSVAECPLSKTDVPKTDVSASDAIADFTDNNRGGNDGETFSELESTKGQTIYCNLTFE